MARTHLVTAIRMGGKPALSCPCGGIVSTEIGEAASTFRGIPSPRRLIVSADTE